MEAASPQPTVVVVDDDDAVRSALKFWLELEGFAVETHESGRSLAAAEVPASGCLVLDYDLPEGDGLQLLRGLRARDVSLPAVLITSRASRAVRSAAAAAGVPIIEKPLLCDALLETVQHALETGAARATDTFTNRGTPHI